MLVSFMAATLMLQPANPKEPYPKTEKAALGSVYNCTPLPCRLVKTPNPDGTRTLVEVRSTSDDTPPQAPTYAFFKAARPITITPREETQSSPNLQPLAPNAFWWRYFRGIWPMEQTPRVAAASDGTNVIFVEGSDAANLPIEYIIVLPEDVIPANATESAPAVLNVTFQGANDAITSTIAVSGLPCQRLLDLNSRIAAARFRAFTGTPGGEITMIPPQNQPAKPVTDDPTVERIVRQVIQIAEDVGNLRKAVQPPPANCP